MVRFYNQPGLWIGKVTVGGTQENYVVPPLAELTQLSIGSGIIGKPNLLGKTIELSDEWAMSRARPWDLPGSYICALPL